MLDLPGYGDVETWPKSIGPRDPRYDDSVIDDLAKDLVSAWMKDGDRIGEASTELTDAEFESIDRAHAERDALKLFSVRDAAIRRVLEERSLQVARETVEDLLINRSRF